MVKQKESLKREVNFRKLEGSEKVQDADVVIPREVIRKAQEKLDNVLFGYFLGNRLPFPVVDYYAKNAWSKFGFVKAMMNSSGFFFFKFESKEGMDKVLDAGPWLIRKVPLFLNVWSPSISLKKEGIKSVPVWVKLHNVPIAVYTDDGLSLLASKLGVPKRLDSYTADMCVENWGRSSFARALIELNAESEIKDHITISIPKLDEEGYLMERVDVEYEWKPLRCSLCCVFGHNDQNCSKNVQSKKNQVVIDDDGFISDRRKTIKLRPVQKNQKPRLIYKPKMSTTGPSTSGTKDDLLNNDKTSNVSTKNSFEVLSKNDGNVEDLNPDDGFETRPSMNNASGSQMHMDDEVVDLNPTEMSKFMRNDNRKDKSEGASTPGQDSLNG
ncbi:uncharacterized protein LOC110891390 [Helianthus annuus]|uniref:uncharacterized protein LOC110891390 n=1 Tax=Helianthus annuus TaxID=4232 RepID=UPI000B8F7862|nr:uncharacterized protein LOC110891390 [Helianthus annuus]